MMIDLKLFCAKYDDCSKTPPLSDPWTVNGNTYACDGHMIIRVEARPEVTRGLPEILKDGFHKLRWYQPGQETTPFPTYEPIKKKRCPYCDGTGKAQTCPECQGEGTVEFNNGYHDYEFDCRSCDGDGVVACYGDGSPCPRCHGDKVLAVDHYESVYIGDCRLAKGLLDKIKDLPGVFLGPTTGIKDGMVPFVFEGGDGVLMCMTK